MSELVKPYGGRLKTLYLSDAECAREWEGLKECPSWTLTGAQICDLELLMDGAFSPMDGFMGPQEWRGVRDAMRLPDGTFWPVPLTLDVDASTANALDSGSRLALRDEEGVPLAVVAVDVVWGSGEAGCFHVAGKVRGLRRPTHYDFLSRRHTPAELRAALEKRGWRRVVAVSSKSPFHRGHQALAVEASRRAEANLMVHASVAPGAAVDAFTRARVYEKAIPMLADPDVMLSYLPLRERRLGAREVMLHAIVRQNYGASHFAVCEGAAEGETGHAGTRPTALEEILARHGDELDIEVMVFPPLGAEGAAPDESVPTTAELVARLRAGKSLPEWLIQVPLAEELRKSCPPLHRRGFVVFLTGLSGAGKSTIANALRVKLMEIGPRQVTLLDGDVVRQHLSSELGFSREHRDLNILRIGYVASEIAKNGGAAICAPIAPYRETRRQVRQIVEQTGAGLFEVHVATPLAVCEKRDRKGLYAKARAGIIKGFTGIDDPYEEPEAPELRIDTRDYSADEAARRILLRLESAGYIAPPQTPQE